MPNVIKEGQVITRAKNRAAANFIPAKSFRARKVYYNSEINMAEIDDLAAFSGGASDSEGEVLLLDSNDEEELFYTSVGLPELQFRKTTSTARWKEEMGVAEIVANKGRTWTTTGIVRSGKIYCSVEDTLYLAEVGALNLISDDDRCHSLEDIYKKVAEGKCGCCWEAFEAYKHLKSLGYIVKRHGVPWSTKSIKNKSQSVEGAPQINLNKDMEYDDISFIIEIFNRIEINEVRPVFDVYPPNSKFKKSSPGNPVFVLCLTSDRPPSKAEIEKLERRCDDTPVKFCQVDHGHITFLSFDRVELPILP